MAAAVGEAGVQLPGFPVRVQHVRSVDAMQASVACSPRIFARGGSLIEKWHC